MKKKILILCNMLTGGGAERVTQDVANYLAENEEYAVTVVALNDGKKTERVFSNRIKIVSCRRPHNLRKMSVGGLWFRFRQLLVCLYCALIHANVVLSLREGLPMLLAARLHSEVCIAWLHNDMYHFRIMKQFFRADSEELLFLMKFNRIVCVSEYVRESVVNTIGDPGNTIVCYNPLNADAINKAADKISVPADYRPVFVIVSRFSQEKRILEFLKVTKQIAEQHQFSLWIVGDGEDKDKAEKYIKDNQLSCVRLWGWQENPYPFIKSADWLISVSKYESYGLAIQEAIICGTPVIATDLPVLKECVQKDMLIITGTSMEELKNELERILEQPEQFIELCSRPNISWQEEVYIKRIKEIERLFN